MIASLPMYDLAPITAATDAWWQGLARHLRAEGVADVPATLTRDESLLATWQSPDLLLSQTCGYPLTHALAGGQVQLVATPHYNAPGCDGARYASALIVAADSTAEKLTDLGGGVAVINSRDSHSGYNVLRYMAAQATAGRPLFRETKVSGAHIASIRAVAARQADIAAVDAVTHALLARHMPDVLTGTRVLAYSPRAPGLPYITRGDVTDSELARLRAGLQAAIADPTLAPTREALLIEDAEVISFADYQAITDMEFAADGTTFTGDSMLI